MKEANNENDVGQCSNHMVTAGHFATTRQRPVTYVLQMIMINDQACLSSCEVEYFV